MKRLSTLLSLLLFVVGLSAQINSVQIGSASNAYSTYISGGHSLSFVPGTGTNGGSLSFVHRENTSLHTGGSSGRIRYSFSTNGGTSWTTEQGPVTVLNTFLSRYPSCKLFNPNPTSTSLGDLNMAVVCPTLTAAGTGFEGTYVGMLDSAVNNPFSVLNITQEQYINRAASSTSTTRISRSLVQRVPGEFWFIIPSTNVRDVDVYKGVYNASMNRIDWVRDRVLVTGFRTGALQSQGQHIAFSPDGSTGYIAMAGDLTGGINGTYAPILSTTTDSGATWSVPQEIDMRIWYRLVDSLTSVAGGSGYPAIGSRYPVGSNVIPNVTDLTVDGNGNPHFLVLVDNEVSSLAPNYNMAENKLMLVDITQDTFGNWEGVYVAEKSTRRAVIGNPSVANGSLFFETWMQVTRNADGTKIFYSWNDTDTTAASWTLGSGNSAPDLYGRGYDVSTGMMTPVVCHTCSDATWQGRILTPTVAEEVITRGSTHSVPTMVMELDSLNASLLNPVRYHFFSNINYTNSQFTQTPVYFRTYCGDFPLTISAFSQDAICGNNNGIGKINITSPSSPGPYTYTWSSGQTVDSVGTLAAGSYTITVEDDSSCVASISINITNTPGPQIDSIGHTDVTCFGGVNGTAFAMASGGTAPLSYTWITGDTTASVINLTASIYNVTITDVNGCTVDTTITVSEPTAVSVVTNGFDPSCFGGSDGSAGAVAGGGTPGYTYSWSNGDLGANTSNTLAAGAYTVTVTDTNGCTGMTSVNIFDPPAITSATSTFNVTCFGGRNGSATATGMGGTPPFNYTWSNGVTLAANNNIPAGTFYVTITDSKGCEKIDSVLIEQPDMIAGNPTVSNVSCFGEMDGSIMLNVTGGTAPFNFTWTNGGTTQDLTGLPGGTYAVTIIDANNCTGSAVAQLTEPPAMVLNATFTPDNGTGNGTATANVTGGNPPYMYDWLSGQTTKTITGLFAGNYIITVTDANGCEQKDTILVTSNVGIEELASAGIRILEVFPNPSTGVFHLNIGLVQVQPLKLEVYDLRGKAILTKALRAAKEFEEVLDLEGLAKGAYFLRITTPHGMGHKHLIVK